MHDELHILLKEHQEDLELDDIQPYLQKILRYARIISYYDQGLKGFIAFYCNDEKKLTAFITMIVVSKSSIGKSIGKFLLETALSNMIASGFIRCRLEVLLKNEKAMKFYIRHGFKVLFNEGKSIIMEKELK